MSTESTVPIPDSACLAEVLPIIRKLVSLGFTIETGPTAASSVTFRRGNTICSRDALRAEQVDETLTLFGESGRPLKAKLSIEDRGLGEVSCAVSMTRDAAKLFADLTQSIEVVRTHWRETFLKE